MAFESEVIPLFIGGVTLVTLIELIAGCIMLKGEKENIEIVKLILKELGKSESLIKFVKDRWGHDRRYAIDSTKITEELSWKPKYTFETGIIETINWYLDNQDWMEKVKSGEYQEYYEKMYSKKWLF